MPKIDSDGKEYIEQDGKIYHKNYVGDWEPETDALGNVKVNTDWAGRPIIETDWAGHQIVERDYFGNPLLKPEID